MPLTLQGVAGDLQDRVVVIIGGTSGLGLSAAKACNAAGAKLVVVGREGEAEAARSELGARSIVIEADATNSHASESAIAEAVKSWGKLDALYHVAGGSARKLGDGPLHEISDEGWRHAIDLNLSSLFYSNRAAARQFIAQDSGGTVLNVGSVLASSPSPKHFTTHGYAAAKSAAIGFTHACAAYYAPQNIRFNMIVPGLVRTPMSQRATEDGQIMRFIRTKQPLDGARIGEPSDLDAAVVYFLSDASKFVTGQILAIDGGWSVTEGQYS